jgi:hypothetical protein
MDNSKLFEVSCELLKIMDKTVDDGLPEEIAEIVKSHSKGAAIAALGSAWIPGIGGTAAVTIAAGFVWSMYLRINSKIELSLSENIIKTVASGIATNLAAWAIASLAISTALSFLPGLGNVGASAIMCGTCYALTLASGFVYLKILTRVFKAGKDPTSMTADDLKEVAKEVVQNEDIKAFMKEAKEEYKAAKAHGEIKKEYAQR